MYVKKHHKQMSLGELIKALENLPDKQIYFDFCAFVPARIHSYRGYYEDLALSYTHTYVYEQNTSHALLDTLRNAVGKTYSGWKGGDYIAYEECPMWVANSGETGDTVITGVKERGDCIVIKTKFIP